MELNEIVGSSPIVGALHSDTKHVLLNMSDNPSLNKPDSEPLKLTLLTTGGTLDGTCHDLGVIGGPSLLRSTLDANRRLNVSVTAICNKDSRDLTEEDREAILNQVVADSTGRVLVGHGTYTICETGRFLKANLGATTKRVLLVGAWIPLEYPNTDAPNQIAFAVKSIEDCSPGVYVAMDGKLWDPALTEKRQISEGRWQMVGIGT